MKPPEGAIVALLEGRHDDPFSLLGVHSGPTGVFARVWLPGAELGGVLGKDGMEAAFIP